MRENKDKDRFELLYSKHYKLVFNYCFRRTLNFELARDICAETFLKAYLNLYQYRGKDDKIRSWLYGIATNELKQYFRTQKYRPQLVEATYGSEYTFTNQVIEKEKADAEAQLVKLEQFKRIQEALTLLPLKYQEVISLKYFEHFTIAEISQILNKKEGTIKSLLSRGIVKLRQKLTTKKSSQWIPNHSMK